MTFSFILLILAQAAPVDELPSTTTETSALGDTSDTTPGEVPQDDSIVVTGEPDDDDEVVCRLEKTIGTNIKKRVCRTNRQIREEAAAAQALAREGYMRRNQKDAGAASVN